MGHRFWTGVRFPSSPPLQRSVLRNVSQRFILARMPANAERVELCRLLISCIKILSLPLCCPPQFAPSTQRATTQVVALFYLLIMLFPMLLIAVFNSFRISSVTCVYIDRVVRGSLCPTRSIIAFNGTLASASREMCV